MTLSSFVDWLPCCRRHGTLDSYHHCGGVAMVIPHCWWSLVVNEWWWHPSSSVWLPRHWGKLVQGKGGGVLTWAGRTQPGHHHQTSHCHIVSPCHFIVSPRPCRRSFGWWHGIIFGGRQLMWAVDRRCGWLTIDVGGSGHSDHGDGQWWPGVVVDGGLRKREEVCVCVRLRGVFVFGYELYLYLVTNFGWDQLHQSFVSLHEDVPYFKSTNCCRSADPPVRL